MISRGERHFEFLARDNPIAHTSITDESAAGCLSVIWSLESESPTWRGRSRRSCRASPGHFGRIFWTRYLAARGRMWVFRSERALTFLLIVALLEIHHVLVGR